MPNKIYQDELAKKRISNLVQVAKDHIKKEIENKERRTPTKKEIDKIYKERIKEYEKKINYSLKGFATGGPAAM